VTELWVALDKIDDLALPVSIIGFDGLKNISFHSLDVAIDENGRSQFIIRTILNVPSIVDLVPVGEFFNALFSTISFS
jgi:hypothetical protein